ncbi:hypothetical protein GCM10007190_06410 [Macrococcus hajekii]|nr:N-acetylglucosaminidase [Macrococcus hajekii]GGB01044.1 hypothetical protein GCM10007190_06410 [Macrococcus hajekii]
MQYFKYILPFTLMSSLMLTTAAEASEKPLRVGHIKNMDTIIVTSKNAMTKKVAGDYAHYTLYINDKVIIANKPYYRVQTSEDINHAIGYVQEDELIIEPVKIVSKPAETIQLSASTKVYNIPDGTERQVIDRAQKNETLSIEQTLQVGQDTYHKITRSNGLTGWIKSVSSSPVQQSEQSADKSVNPTPEPVVKSTSVPGARIVNTRFNDAVTTQMKLSPKPQYSNGIKWSDASKQAVIEAMDPGRLAHDPVNRYQFLTLTEPQGLTVEQLNHLLKGKGILEGRGQAFKTASERYRINEIYLISHAFLETGEGTSKLATGQKVKGAGNKKYYNMFGIGAFDKNAAKYGAQYAANVGWDTPDKAIIGGAEFISSGYLKASQNTLYQMRWNPDAPGQTQYATDVLWATANARYLAQFYQQLGIEGTHYQFIQYQS